MFKLQGVLIVTFSTSSVILTKTIWQVFHILMHWHFNIN